MSARVSPCAVESGSPGRVFSASFFEDIAVQNLNTRRAENCSQCRRDFNDPVQSRFTSVQSASLLRLASVLTRECSTSCRGGRLNCGRNRNANSLQIHRGDHHYEDQKECESQKTDW